MKYEYHKKEVDESVINSEKLRHLYPEVKQILANRGYDTEEKIVSHLFGSLERVLESTAMIDLDVGVARLKKAVESGEHIVVYRDYDCDGCCAGAVAVECLLKLGAIVTHFSNNREKDGYGMCNNGIDRILERDPETTLIVTVDNGIAALEQIDYAVSKGLEVIVTDHHTPGEQLPRALAIIDPKRADEVTEFRDLCGAGVIFKVMIALYRSLERDIAPVLDSLDLVALATVADVVSMEGENRILVREGISVMMSGKRPFFRELKAQKNITNISANSEIGFQIAPIVNAVSRMAWDTDLVVDAFLSENNELVKSRVEDFIILNEQRKELTNNAMMDVETVMAEKGIDPENDCCILVTTPSVPSGLVGLVSGRLTSEFYKVSGVFHLTPEGVLKGSMRGVDGFHIKLALDKITPELLIAHGGHSKAAGLTLLPEHYPQFEREFKALVEEAFPDGKVEGTRELDLVVVDGECTEEMVRSLEVMEPFGENFPAPLFGVSTTGTDVRFMGKEQNHVKFISKENTSFIRWNYGQKARKLKKAPTKFVGAPSLNEFRGQVTLQFFCEYQE